MKPKPFNVRDVIVIIACAFAPALLPAQTLATPLPRPYHTRTACSLFNHGDACEGSDAAGPKSLNSTSSS